VVHNDPGDCPDMGLGIGAWTMLVGAAVLVGGGTSVGTACRSIGNGSRTKRQRLLCSKEIALHLGCVSGTGPISKIAA